MQRARTFMDMDSEDSEVTARPRVVNRDQGYLHPSLGLCNHRYLFSNPLPLSTPLCQNTCLMFLRLPRQSPILFLIISRYIKWSLTGEKNKRKKEKASHAYVPHPLSKKFNSTQKSQSCQETEDKSASPKGSYQPSHPRNAPLHILLRTSRTLLHLTGSTDTGTDTYRRANTRSPFKDLTHDFHGTAHIIPTGSVKLERAQRKTRVFDEGVPAG